MYQSCLKRSKDFLFFLNPFLVKGNSFCFTASGWTRSSRLLPCSIRKALTYVLDLCAPPQQSFLANLSQLAKNPKEQVKLQLLADVSWRRHQSSEIDFVRKKQCGKIMNSSLILHSTPEHLKYVVNMDADVQSLISLFLS